METTDYNEVLAGLLQAFPFSSIREAQQDALATIARTVAEEKSITLIEAPTGSGKSGIGMAAALWSAQVSNGAHYLTSQNSLTEQLLQDFGSRGLVTLKGRANYSCAKHRSTCDVGSALNADGKDCERCPYRHAKDHYSASPVGCTNYSYYLTERRHVGQLDEREFLILDEAHNIEKELLSSSEISLTPHRVLELGAGLLPHFSPNSTSEIASWIGSTLVPEAKKFLHAREVELEMIRSEGSAAAVARLLPKIAGVKSLLNNLVSFVDEGSEGEWHPWSSDDGSLTIRKLSASGDMQAYLSRSAPNVVLMSATILDIHTFSRTLGLPYNQTVAVRMASDFPVSTRPIYSWPVGSMSAKNQQATIPAMIARIAAILDRFANEKGIIHTHSYKVNTLLYDGLAQDPKYRDRIITHSNVRGARETAIAKHFSTPSPTVLMSPSMTEGIDLKGDRSRFQIITKVPYPFLDSYNRARIERDPKWYQMLTAITLLQASGRSNRSSDDYAVTIILDSDITRFITANQDIIPEWWLNAVEFR
jgi:ATP-dependent DNA helicase DinG